MKVSIVIATLNEENTIGKVIESLLNQDYSKTDYEIIFADGLSKDKTREIIQNYAKKSKVKITLLKNQKVDSGSGRNLGIKKSKGKYIVQLSGHTIAAKNLLKTLIPKLEKADPDVAGVGCMHSTPRDAPFLQKVFGAVLGTYLGGFGTSQIQSEGESFVESLSFIAYKKKILFEVGLNDSSFKVGQDAELNVRIRKKGYKLLYTPKTHVLYFKRSSFPKFEMQMFRYGFARYKVIKKHAETQRWFYMIPALFVIGFTSLGILANLSSWAYFLFTILVLVYIGILAGFSIRNSRTIRFALAMSFAYITLHFAYGYGFIYGVLKK